MQRRTGSKSPGTRAATAALVFLSGLLIAACSHKALSVFFDLPPPEVQDAEDSSPAIVYSADETGVPVAVTVNTPVTSREALPIESVQSWEAALEMLPRTQTGSPDWLQAINDGVIAPRAIDESQPHSEFGLDFKLQAANPMFDAWFPHSSHTRIMSCDNCHGSIFPYRNNEMTMAKINQGQYCGACHGKVGFPLNECKRCHTSMP